MCTIRYYRAKICRHTIRAVATRNCGKVKRGDEAKCKAKDKLVVDSDEDYCTNCVLLLLSLNR